MTSVLKPSVDQHRADVVNILNNQDPRTLFITGPCAVDDIEACLDFARRLKELQERHPEYLFMIRLCGQKPRTKDGWEGWIADPAMDGSRQTQRGLYEFIELLQQVYELGLPIATELLFPEFTPHIAPYLSLGWIGARSVSHPPLRYMSANVSFPILFKNATDGSFADAIHAIITASKPQIDMIKFVQQGDASPSTSGNPNTMILLRGGVNGPNFDWDSMQIALQELEAKGITPRLGVDLSHGNSIGPDGKKHYKNQISGYKTLQQIVQQHALQSVLRVIMTEAYLVEGKGNEYGQSKITDPCINFGQLEHMLRS